MINNSNENNMGIVDEDDIDSEDSNREDHYDHEYPDEENIEVFDERDDIDSNDKNNEKDIDCSSGILKPYYSWNSSVINNRNIRCAV